ncbi:uncharacterized protein BDCG_00647 [Blastomyces dermatitidis ER-3]|uniref:DUF7820 domain-containing protein n=3 Tax=Blastomyces TaxID=229219 RepID=A0A179UV70_BLAGS|nr:uncharacterized protein BDBG_07420 [Blastomyces gilchristii SLH14081]XP_045271951.1 uncharacterized protein BDCG_00647 [Blastomyces dermatitidis ER-3]EGE80176.1 hypothetical protein BDDG_03117 [Blastomyces dermatitidis ATCC 18188]EQL37327.1 hypothetical protein BDFG_01296 [Blastomyces dermatitidis ATCC 26199]EEQ83842.1 hypothetical protein BDCG_00647 [Blastomyces dermatitidis ER-3]OAT12016.1 hypothetical protein BDBG_07420 [Blastomyces gilchristii SLH14081]
MSGRALSPSPEEIHDRSFSARSHRRQSSHSAGRHSAEHSPITDVFSDAFSLEPLESFVDSDVAIDRCEQSDHPSSNSSTTLDAEDGLSSHLSPFRDSVASFQSQMSQRSGSPEPEPIPEPEQSAPSRASTSAYNAVSSSITRHPSSASSTTNPHSSVAHRSISTSSRFSMPRALSPYTGQTMPAHPYAMYPQATGLGRSSSTSSTSTVRPVERNNVEPMAPQHPYAMYPQNTVPEEEDTEVHSPIPVGFPGREQAFQSRGNQGANEVGDIVGVDGHAEQLPPYTRYPDGLPQKFGAHEYVSPPPPQPLAHAPISPESEVSSRTLLDENSARRESAPPAGEPQADDPSGSNKEQLAQTRRTRVCCGLQIWAIILIAIVVLIGAVIGGVVGGVVGNKRGEKAGGASASSALGGGRPTSVFVTVTATTMLDAAHLTTTPTLLPIPTGQFQIPAASLHRSPNNCVNADELSKSWQCMRKGAFSCNLSEAPDGSKSLHLQPYERGGQFVYGAQPPVLEETNFDLKLMLDKTEPELGPALFFFTPFDKLVILHEDDFPTASGQAVDGTVFRHRAETTPPVLSKPSDRPYFCWWNSTYLELFIYVNHPTSKFLTTTGQYTSTQTSTTFTTAAVPPALDVRGLRSILLETPNGMPQEYPRMIKLEEKRSSTDGIPPYCEQMQVMDDGTISGPLGSRVPIDEIETTLSSRRNNDNHLDYHGDDCFCQWIVR